MSPAFHVTRLCHIEDRFLLVCQITFSLRFLGANFHILRFDFLLVSDVAFFFEMGVAFLLNFRHKFCHLSLQRSYHLKKIIFFTIWDTLPGNMFFQSCCNTWFVHVWQYQWSRCFALCMCIQLGPQKMNLSPENLSSLIGCWFDKYAFGAQRSVVQLHHHEALAILAQGWKSPKNRIVHRYIVQHILFNELKNGEDLLPLHWEGLRV